MFCTFVPFNSGALHRLGLHHAVLYRDVLLGLDELRNVTAAVLLAVEAGHEVVTVTSASAKPETMQDRMRVGQDALVAGHSNITLWCIALRN